MRTLSRLLAVAGLALSCVATPVPAHADQTVCVPDIVALKAQLAAWTTAADGSLLTIRLVQGTYAIDNAAAHTLGLFFASTAASLELLGGYTPGCGGRVLDPDNTVIDGRDELGGSVQLKNINGSVLVEGITFTRLGYGLELVHGAGAGASSTDHELQLRHAKVVGNRQEANGCTLRLWGIGTGTTGARVAVVNSLIADNTNMLFYLVTGNGGAIALTHSTVANNSVGSNTEGGVQIYDFASSEPTQYRVLNNVISGNKRFGQPFDLSLAPAAASNSPASGYRVDYNLVGAVTQGIVQAHTLLAMDPQFRSVASGDYRLATGSVAIGYGSPAAPGDFPGVPATDLEGNARLSGASLDLGAYQTDSLFENGYE